MWQQSQYLQAVGQAPDQQIYGPPVEQFRYPDAAGSAYLTQFGHHPMGADEPGLPPTPWYQSSAFTTAMFVARIGGTAIGAYHGYKRNNSVGWAIAWSILGGLFPYVTVPVALAQGVGKRKV